ncbi:unnamed protein product [Mytilus coruscus]|uniref:C3H1-type domain-containing protein n=1 Tax=Mytilus coruscus TaxID=42192 RepID=A0A6J8EAK2_MYTCO|nr:unnamed protein product [Mytilus coruscus]
MTSQGNTGNSCVQENEVQHHVDSLNRNIQGNEDQNHDTNNEVVSPEVLAVQPTVQKQILGGQSAFVSCSLKTGGNIPDKIKQQIWAGRYIDFHSHIKYKLQLVQGADNPELSITEERKKRTLTLNQWLSAWNKFTAIICTKNPVLGSVIPQHMESILEMSREGGNWQYYDIEFRKLLERGEAQWGCTHLELYLRAKLQVNLKSGNDKTNKSGNTRWPIGVCFSFHKGLGCKFGEKCKFQHRCFNCGFNHSFSTCKKPVRLPYKFTKPVITQKRYKAGTTSPFEWKTEYPPYLVTETMPLPQGQKKLSPPENEVNYNSNCSTPVKVDRLSYWLKGYNIKMYKYLVKWFKYGFDVGFRGSVHHNTVDNLLSAKTKPDIVRRKIQNEISANRFVGPFDSKPFTEMQLSPLGLAKMKLSGT